MTNLLYFQKLAEGLSKWPNFHEGYEPKPQAESRAKQPEVVPVLHGRVALDPPPEGDGEGLGEWSG